MAKILLSNNLYIEIWINCGSNIIKLWPKYDIIQKEEKIERIEGIFRDAFTSKTDNSDVVRLSFV